MKKLDSAQHLDKKLDESRRYSHTGRKAFGIDIWIVPIKNELVGAQMFLAKDRKKLLSILLKNEEENIIKELTNKNLGLYKD